jgi:RNA polymerase sigma-70 factor (ECF subfamily)
MPQAGHRHGDREAAALASTVSGGGHPAEEARLCELLAPRVRRYGLRHLRDGTLADDLVQQVLLVTLEKLRGGGVRDCGQIASFVLGVSRTVARDMRRAGWRRGQMAEAWGREQERTAGPDEPIDGARLHDCLSTLADRDRLIVTMAFYVEASTSDISTRLGLTEANVRVIKHRTMGRLRDCLQRAPAVVIA